MNVDEFLEYAHQQIEQQYGSQKAFAKHAGLSTQFVNDVLRGRRTPVGRFVKALGFKRVVVYVKENSN